MKRQVRQGSDGVTGCREGSGHTGWADVDAWLGYEFWSSQVEAAMEPWGEPERLEELLSPERLAACRKEADSDVRPF
jgi:hypothetical protein